MYKQDAPFSVQLEFSEGCNLYCSFCGLQGIREKHEKNYKFATRETIERIVEQIGSLGWTSRIEIAMHGEPTMHPEFIQLIGLIRSGLPKNQIMLTTNGGGLLGDTATKIHRLFMAGLNVLALDDYEGIRIIGKVRAVEHQIRIMVHGLEVYNYPLEPKGNPHQRGPITRRMISYLRDPTITTVGTHSLITNHAGAAFPKNEKMAGKRCHRPFREIAFRWDGSVAICCNDWRGNYKCGNVNEMPLNDIWQGDEFHAARQKLYAGERDFGPCAGCDARSYRVGLLPDPSGKSEMSPPDWVTEATIAAALDGAPYTAPILRPWEK